MATAFQKATGIPSRSTTTRPARCSPRSRPRRTIRSGACCGSTARPPSPGSTTQGLLLKGFEPNVSWNSLGTASLPAGQELRPDRRHARWRRWSTTRPRWPTRPTTWQALLSSKWKGQVGMNDPSQSGPTYPFIAGMMNYLGGVSQGEAFFTKLKTNGWSSTRPTARRCRRSRAARSSSRSCRARPASAPRSPDDEPRGEVPQPGDDPAERDRHRRQGARGRAGGGRGVRRVRALAAGPEGHADRRPDRRLALLPGAAAASSRCRRCRRWPASRPRRSTPTPGARRRDTINTWFDTNIVQ